MEYGTTIYTVDDTVSVGELRRTLSLEWVNTFEDSLSFSLLSWPAIPVFHVQGRYE